MHIQWIFIIIIHRQYALKQYKYFVWNADKVSIEKYGVFVYNP